MRKRLIAGNWKMNKTLKESKSLAQDILEELKGKEVDVDVVVAPTLININGVAEVVEGNIAVAAQNCSDKEGGAYTGEVTANMVKEAGGTHVILGHSERRAYFGETNELLSEKVNRVLDQGLTPIYCCGEELGQRKDGSYFKVIENQVKAALFHLSAEQFKSLVIAYEPVWAIGTGETATPDQAQEVHAFIRKLLVEQYGEVGNQTRILYGGSMKPGNAKELLSQEDIDGGLIGGASLKAADFVAIIEA